jgi:hypothetical protein
MHVSVLAFTRRNREWLIKSVMVHSIVQFTWITVVILELIHAFSPYPRGAGAVICPRPFRPSGRLIGDSE